MRHHDKHFIGDTMPENQNSGNLSVSVAGLEDESSDFIVYAENIPGYGPISCKLAHEYVRCTVFRAKCNMNWHAYKEYCKKYPNHKKVTYFLIKITDIIEYINNKEEAMNKHVRQSDEYKRRKKEEKERQKYGPSLFD